MGTLGSPTADREGGATSETRWLKANGCSDSACTALKLHDRVNPDSVEAGAGAGILGRA